jgi:hypothetical protein
MYPESLVYRYEMMFLILSTHDSEFTFLHYVNFIVSVNLQKTLRLLTGMNGIS